MVYYQAFYTFLNFRLFVFRWMPLMQIGVRHYEAGDFLKTKSNHYSGTMTEGESKFEVELHALYTYCVYFQLPTRFARELTLILVIMWCPSRGNICWSIHPNQINCQSVVCRIHIHLPYCHWRMMR